MEIKIIGKSVVPDKITLYENDLGAKHLVFSSNKINDGVNLEFLSGFLEVEREEGVSDRFILDKTINGDTLYFTLPINLALTETADLISAQLVFENGEKTLSYRTKVFYIDVKNSVDGVSSYEQVVPTVLSQLESKMEKAVDDCESIKNEIENAKVDFENNIEETSSKIKDEVLAQVSESSIDDALSTESTNPVQNKVVTEALNNKLESEDLTNYVKNTDYATTSTAGVVKTAGTYGITISSGVLKTLRATKEEIDTGNDDKKPIVPASVSYAVMRGLTEPTAVGQHFPFTWTDDRKLKARQTIGATKLYKHIISGQLTDYDNTIFDFELIFYSTRSDAIGFNFIPTGSNGNYKNYIFLEPEDVICVLYAKTSNANGDSITCPIELGIWEIDDVIQKFAYRIDTQVNSVVVENHVAEGVYEI